MSEAAPNPVRSEAQHVGEVLRYIRTHWDQTVRTAGDTPGVLPLPARFVSPTIGSMFRAMFYWDTFYACLGLIRQDRTDVVEDCVTNFLYLIDRLGFVPNFSGEHGINRSQLPHAALLVDLLDRARGGDEALIARAYPALEAEWRFWAQRRGSPSGLSAAGHSADGAYLEGFLRVVNSRVRGEPAEAVARRRWVEHALAECEVWDFTPRFDRRCMDFNPVDQNALLFAHETLLAQWADRLSLHEERRFWQGRADHRRALMHGLMWDEERGWFMDYDWRHARRATLRSAAGLYALTCGVAEPAQAQRMAQSIQALLLEHGVTTCEPLARDDGQRYQWDHPNAWPPCQYAAYEGLRRYGYPQLAHAVAGRYIDTVTRAFRSTGDLWEKYNAVTGKTDVVDEYRMPAMMGWTAGVYVHFAAELGFSDRSPP